MKSEEIKVEITALELQRDELIRQIHTKRTAYLQALNDESEFQEGDPVVLFRQQHNAIGGEKKVGSGIYGSIFMNNGRPKYCIWKVKQDGTQSKNNWSPYDFDRIEKAAQ